MLTIAQKLDAIGSRAYASGVFVRTNINVRGYKKTYLYEKSKIGNYFIKKHEFITVLRIPYHTPCFVSFHTSKFRAAKAEVIEHYAYNKYTKTVKKTDIKTTASGFDCDFKYTIGKIVKPRNSFSKAQDTCSSGIHFFVSMNDAKRWLG